MGKERGTAMYGCRGEHRGKDNGGLEEPGLWTSAINYG